MSKKVISSPKMIFFQSFFDYQVIPPSGYNSTGRHQSFSSSRAFYQNSNGFEPQSLPNFNRGTANSSSSFYEQPQQSTHLQNRRSYSATISKTRSNNNNYSSSRRGSKTFGSTRDNNNFNM